MYTYPLSCRKYTRKYSATLHQLYEGYTYTCFDTVYCKYSFAQLLKCNKEAECPASRSNVSRQCCVIEYRYLESFLRVGSKQTMWIAHRKLNSKLHSLTR